MAIRHWHLDSGSIRINNFPENEIQLTVPIIMFVNTISVAIDSTGVKAYTARAYISSETVKHAKKGVLYAHAQTPSATDAVVRVELVDDTTGDTIAYVTYSGDSGLKNTIISEDTIKALSGHEVYIRINVTTASATAGATQNFIMSYFAIVLGIR